MRAPAELIRHKRDGGALAPQDIADFVAGLVNGQWSDAQAAALAMAVLWRGMDPTETARLTQAMADSGQRLHWHGPGLDRPIVDKHSTGGVGDKLSLMLAPLLAACGALVPMVSGRGLGHTGGTLDKLEALPGYRVDIDPQALQQVLRHSGCAIVGAGPALAPADKRLYAIRDLTATVESVPLITASILSKKLAAGLQSLVLDVKCGRGAFAPTPEAAQALAQSLVDTSVAAGLPACALITDADAVIGRCAGNALEVQEAIDFLTGRTPPSGPPQASLQAMPSEPVQADVTLALGAQMLRLAGLADSDAQAHASLHAALASGQAAERFARMVAALGGPPNVLADARLPRAPVLRPVPAPHAGVVVAMDTRALGLQVVALGGGRTRADDRIDPRVGLSAVAARGQRLHAGEPLAWVNAANAEAATAAVQAVQAAFTLGEQAAARPSPVLGCVTASG